MMRMVGDFCELWMNAIESSTVLIRKAKGKQILCRQESVDIVCDHFRWTVFDFLQNWLTLDHHIASRCVTLNGLLEITVSFWNILYARRRNSIRLLKSECFGADSKISFQHPELWRARFFFCCCFLSGRANVIGIVVDNSAKHNSNTITLHSFRIARMEWGGQKKKKKKKTKLKTHKQWQLN